MRANLRGPSFLGTIAITTTPGQPIHLPAFSQPGTHFVEDIRLETPDGQIIRARPDTVTVNVLDQLLVGAVTSRPLTLDEIRAFGIQFDENSFQAFTFTIALTSSSGVVTIDMPVLVPINGGSGGAGSVIQFPGLGLESLPGLQLPNLGIEPIMLEPIEEAPPGVTLPPIPGIIIIPGNIAYLNQFFSVLLSVSNQAPNGTPLVVRDVEAEIKLPAGADGVVGDILRDPPFVPGQPEFDNPLRIARTAAGRQNIRPVMAPGPDGVAGTADDVNELAPQRTGTTEFLVEGVREGGHVVDIEIRGVLHGLPSGPIRVAGRTRGSVVVRDPSFALTFMHPRTVRAGTRYDLLVQIQNTSQVAANLVTVSLDAANLTGARLLNPADATQVIDTIPPGGSATVTLHLESLRTGSVTASSLELPNETGVVSGRRLAFRTGVSEQDVPLSPDTLLLPPVTSLLGDEAENADLLFRAIALLGEAHSIATTPRMSLPPGVQPIPASTVTLRARELTEAALRLELSVREGPSGAAEQLPEGLLLTLQDLYFDFLGSGVRDSGWDALYRQSRQARLFGVALADVLNRERALLGLSDLLALQRSWGDTESYRADHLTVTTQTAGGGVPVAIELQDSLGRKLGGSLDPEAGQRQIAGADVLAFSAAGTTAGQFAVLTQLGASPYTATLIAQHTGTFDLGIVVTGSDGLLRQVTFRSLSVTQGETLRAVIRPRQTPLVVLERSGVPIAATSEDLIPDATPRVLGLMQNGDPSVDAFGRVVAVLFSEDVELATAQAATSYAVSPASIPMVPGPALSDGNAVQQALAQFGQRIVFLGLRDPVGPFVRRTLDIGGIRDGRGRVMDPVVARRILPDPDLAAGGQIGGRVLRSDGSAVATPQITYFHSSPDTFGQCSERAITVKHGDDGGRYALDFVPGGACAGAPFRIRARDPATGEEGELRAGIAANGQRLTLDIILVGRGSVQGTVRGPDGQPQPNVAISLISETDLSTRTTSTDQNGVYRITGVAVGAFGLEARSASSSARASGLVLRAGSTTTLDLTIFGPADAVVAGQVRRPDGSPAASADVGIESSASPGLLASARTDAAGSFRFERIAPGGYRVRAIDRAAGQQGEALITVTADNDAENPAYVLVLLAGTGSVSGRITEMVNGAALPVGGALVAGGLQIVTADSGGNYTIPAVPVGQRVIEAVNPPTGSRGSRAVTILTAGQVSQGIDIVLEPLARVTGRVLSPDGQPLAGQEVRIITGEGTGIGGRTFLVRRTQTAADGAYSFDQLEPRSYPLAAIRGTEVANGTAVLSPLVLTSVVDLRLIRPAGSVSGRVVDGTGLGIVAQVAVKARVPNAAGILEFRDAGTTTSDPDTGFRFDNLFPGPYAVTASSFFSPGTATASGTLTEANPTASNITLTLTSNTGSLRGCVLAPDGSPIASMPGPGGTPLPLSVFITSVRLRSELADDGQNPNPDGIRVDASGGCFVSSIPLPPDYYTIEVTDDRTGSPTFGLRGQAQVTVAQGLEATQDVRLLGLGSVTVEVVDQTGHALRGVSVTLRRTTFPRDVRQAFAAAPTDTTPVVFADVTEGPVSLSATVSTDPGVDVGGRNELRGFGGHAVGVVVRNSSTPLRVVVDAAGVVTGRFLRADRTTPVATAQVELHTSSRPTFYGVSDADGRFRFEGIPAGGFTMNGFDASTGRRAESTGHVEQDGQTVTTDLILGPLGRVLGVVLDATRTQPAAGAEVRLSMAGVTERLVTAGVNGTFVFESVPGGTFTLEAFAPNRLLGQARGSLQTEGQEVALELILEGSGRVEGTVRDVFGALVPAAQVTLVGRGGVEGTTVTAGASGQDTGRFVFDVVPLGPVTIEARPQGALTPGDGGAATGTLSTSGEGLVLDVTFDGTIAVGAVVTGMVGAAPVIVSLDSAGRFGGRTVPTTVENGVYLFANVPRAPFTVSATQETPVGTTISASASIRDVTGLPAAGGRLVPDIQLALNPVAIVRGVVRLTDGGGVSGARVTLTAGAFGSLALTAADGRFEFVGIPTGVALRLDIEGPSGGRATFLGSIDEDGNPRDQDGNLVTEIVRVLDVDPPRVLSVNPPSGSVGVPITAPIVVTFSERIDVASLLPCTAPTSPGPITIRLLESTVAPPQLNDPANACDDSNVVPVAMAVSADGLALTLTPGRPLASQVSHVLTLSGPTVGLAGTPVGGIRDLAGLGMAADVTSMFVTRDAIPPAVTAISPAHGANNVSRESLGRVTFSEPVAPASITTANVRLTGASGPVATQLDLILGNTVVVLTPIDGSGGRQLLASDAIYTITVQNVRDVGGNPLAPAVATATFRTIDTIAPIVQSLTGPAGGRDGQFLELRALTADTDVAAVELFADGVLQTRLTTPSAPGEYRGSVAMPNREIHVGARAIDTTGNVGALTAPLAIPLLPDLAPSVALVSPAPGTVVSSGTTVSVTVRADDDVAVKEVRLVVSGAVSVTITRPVEPPTSPVVVEFEIAVPADAPGGALTVAAVAVDTKGESSPAAVITLNVADEIDPVVSITAPAAGTVILPGTTLLNVTVRALDTGRVAEVSLQVPELAYSQTVAILPVASDVTRTFALGVPAEFTESALTLTASAMDRSGRTAVATRTVAVSADAFRVTSVTPVNDATDVPLTTTVVIQLNRAVDPATVTPTAVALTAAGMAVASTTSVGANGSSLTLTPNEPLAPDTRYTLAVSGLADLAGRQITPFESAFTTTPNVDLDPPSVTAVSPASGTVGVPLDTVVHVTFSEPVNPATVTPSTFRLIETATPAIALVANGGFDAGATGWTLADVGTGGWIASGGNPGGYFILNDSGGATDPTISQTISGLVIGRQYRVSGQYRSEDSSFGNPSAPSFGVAVDDVLLGELARPADSGWHPFAFDFTATSTSAALAISAERNGDDSSYGIDNIAVEPFVEGNVTVASDARGATFTPAAPLGAGRTYRAEVFGVTDPGGIAMTAPFTSSFMTGGLVGVVYVQTWESGVGGWTSKHGDADPIVLTDDPSAPTPPMVHQVTRVDSGGNYFSPPITLRAARSYCLSVSIRWVGGGWPFVGIDSLGETWLIGSPAGGAATTVSPDTTEWRRYSAPITFADDVTTIRIKHELWAGAAKPGANLASFDNFVLEEGACPAAPVLPRIVSVTPAAGRQGDTLAVDVIGEFTHFAQGATSASFGDGITVTSLNVVSATTATANIAIDAAAPPGARTVMLMTGGETASLTDGFTVQSGLPVISSVTPSVGTQGDTIDVLVTGRFTNFVQGTTTASFGDGVVVNSVVVQSATSAGVNITIAQSAAVGGRVVTLTTGAEVASLSGGFVIASPPVTVEPDADGDNFPDVVENEVGSNPLDPASTPLTVQPPVTEAVSAPFSLLNTSNLADTTDSLLFVGDAVSAPFSLLNTSNLADTADPLLLVGEAVSAPFSLLNTSNLAGTTDPGLFVGEAVTAPFAVLNTTNLDGTTDLAVFVGEAVSPFFVVQNTTTQSAQASSEALNISNARQQSATGGLPRIAITAPAHEQTVFQGQTIDVDVEALGDGLGAAELLVNGTAFSRDGSAPYAFTFIVPGTVTELSLQAAISDARGNRVISPPVRLLVVPDPRTIVVGRLVDADGRPLSNQTVRVTVSGLHAEFFDYSAPLVTLPDVSGRAVTRSGHASGVNMRNPGRLFGADPYGFAMDPDYAARFSGYLRTDQAGEYTFQLAANEGARLVVGGITVAQMPTGRGELQARSGTIGVAAGLVPIEITYYQSIGDAEIQLLYGRQGNELQVVRPDQLITAIAELQVQTDGFGMFAIANVPANVPAIQLSSDQGNLSEKVAPVAGGIVDLGDVVVRRQ